MLHTVAGLVLGISLLLACSLGAFLIWEAWTSGHQDGAPFVRER